MHRRAMSPMILSVLLLAFAATTVFATATTVETKKRVVDPRVNRLEQYASPDEHNVQIGAPSAMPQVELGTPFLSPGPGRDVGDTWYDYQRNGSMRRMIDVDTAAGNIRVHMVHMMLPDSNLVRRKCWYKCYRLSDGQKDCEKGLPASDDYYAGYCVQNASSNDRGVPGGHNNLAPGTGGTYEAQYWVDNAPGFCDFFQGHRHDPPTAEDSLCFASDESADGYIWPAMALQEGNDTIMHVFACEGETGGGTTRSLAYFRSINPLDTFPKVWSEHYCVDTTYTWTQDIACNDAGKVAIYWHANLPEPPNWGDTASCDTCWDFVQWDNDAYVQISLNGGVDWQPRINITKNVDGEEGWRPYVDGSVLITKDGNVHCAWAAMYWPADANSGGDAGVYNNRIFHWSEDHTTIRTAHDANWDPETCNQGAFALNACKLSLSECDGKLYCLFSQVNDVPNGVTDDCAHESNPGFPSGAGNAELWVTISNNGGDSWDKARNVTNTYTPNCSLTCASEAWPSMARHGTNVTGTGWDDIRVFPGGDDTSHNGYYLDVQYIDDPSPGGAIQNQGFWAKSDVRWFRLACVDPVTEAVMAYTPSKYDYPTWVKYGQKKDTTLTLENIGNCPLTYNVNKYEIVGPPGWLAVNPTSGSMNAGDVNAITVTLNNNQVNPGTVTYLNGGVIVDWQGSGCPPNSPQYDTISVKCWIADTLYPALWDTIHTTCTKLIVGTSGNFGKNGVGGYNMDYVDAGDCDAEADVYLYDGSPVVGYIKNGVDTVVNFSIFNIGMADSTGFIPYGDHTPTTDMGEYEVFGCKFVTNDTIIAIEKTWYAPKDNDTCSFVIECIKIYLEDTLRAGEVTGLRVGEAIDFDIPADSGSDNEGDFDADLNLVYQQGCDRDGESCQPNDNRWGGIDLIEAWKNGSIYKEPATSDPYGAYIADNPTYVYPNSGFVGEELYAMMGNSGYSLADSSCEDLHVVMTFDDIGSLLPGDTYVFYVEIITHWNGTLEDFKDEVRESYRWFCNHLSENEDCAYACCIMPIRGDVNYNGALNVQDLTYLVNYLFKGGAPPPCQQEGDVNGNGALNVQDLTYLVNYLFKGGNPPLACPIVKK